MFTLGFEISIDTLLKINKKIFFVGILQVVLTSSILFPLLLFLGLSFPVALLFGILFSFSSTAVIVKILEEKGMLSDFPGNNIFIILLLQDLFIVPVIFLLPVLFKGNFSPDLITSFLVAAVKPLLIFIAIIIAGRLFLSKLLDILFRYPSHELTILATIFTATFSILALTVVGLPESIAAFLAGVLISEQGKNLAPLSEIRPFRDIFLVLFFVLTGMLLNFSFFIQNIVFIVSLTVLILAVKFAVNYVILRFFSYSPSASVFITSHIANVGEFAVVLGQIAFLSHFLGVKEYNLLLSIFILSLGFIPVITGMTRNAAESLARLGIIKKILPKEAEGLATSQNKEFVNHVVICGHGRVGREVRTMLDLANIPYIIVDFNKKVISELVRANKYAIYGDPSDIDILKAAYIETAKVLVLAVPDTFSQKRIIDTAHSLSPKISIIVRSHVEEDHYDLVNMGAGTIIMPELEAGLRIGAETLSLFKMNEENISLLIKRVRHEHLQ